MSRFASWACALALASCGRATASDPTSATSHAGISIVGDSTRVRLGDPLPRSSPWFDGTRVSLVAARGETIGLQIVRSSDATDPVHMTLGGLDVRVYEVDAYEVTRPSTALYGGSHGRGSYADGLRPAASSTTRVSYVEVTVPRTAASGAITGELLVGAERFPVELAIAPVTLPVSVPRVWAYADPREPRWAALDSRAATADGAASGEERACAALFLDHGVLLAPDVHIDWWPARRADFTGIRDLPVVIPDDPAKVGDVVRAWIAATAGTGHVPFAIPVDEPRTPERRQQLVEIAKEVRAAGGGPSTFRLAVTADPRPEWLGLVDLYIQLGPAATSGAWAYNGSPPWAGAVVLDAESPGARTWGWIAHRDRIPQWYVWDALYWHDRHNRKRTAPAGSSSWRGAPLDPVRDPISFDDGEDRGNLDGVLALPAPGGCRPTLRLAALRRGQQDRALLELAESCDPIATAQVVARTMPRRAWPTDERVWELSRRELLRIAGCKR